MLIKTARETAEVRIPDSFCTENDSHSRTDKGRERQGPTLKNQG